MEHPRQKLKRGQIVRYDFTGRLGSRVDKGLCILLNAYIRKNSTFRYFRYDAWNVLLVGDRKDKSFGTEAGLYVALDYELSEIV